MWARGDLALIQTGNKKKGTNSLATSSNPVRIVKWMFHIHKNTSNWFLVYTVQQAALFWLSLHQEVAISLLMKILKKENICLSITLESLWMGIFLLPLKKGI